MESSPDTPAPSLDSTVPNAPAAPNVPQDSTSPARIKTREAVYSSVPSERSSQWDTLQVKTRDTLPPRQVNGQCQGQQSCFHQNAAPAEHQASHPMEQGRKFVREQQKKVTAQKAGCPLG